MLDIIVPIICPAVILLFIAAVWIYQWRTPLGRSKGMTRSEQKKSPVGLDWSQHVDTLAVNGYQEVAASLYRTATDSAADEALRHVEERKIVLSRRSPYSADSKECLPLMIALLSVGNRAEAIRVYKVCNIGHSQQQAQQAVNALAAVTKIAGLTHSAEIESRTELLVEVNRHLRHGRRFEALHLYQQQTGKSLREAERDINRFMQELSDQ